MSNPRSPSQTSTVWLLCFCSALSLFLGFDANFWRVADQHWFENHQRDMESFVVGRIVKSRQDGIFSGGGLTGQGSFDAGPVKSIEDAGFTQVPDDTNNAPSTLAQDNQYLAYTNSLRFGSFTTYNSQIGGQGMLFGLLDKSAAFSPAEKLQAFHALTSLLSALVLTAIVLWFYLEFGLTVALFVLASAVFSQWLVVFGRNLWWSLWSFYLPIAAVMHQLGSKQERVSRKFLLLGITAFITVFIKCLITGYEYITTTLVMMTVPIIYYAVLQAWGVRKLLAGMFTAAVSSCLAVLLTFVLLCFQVAAVKGSFQDGVNHIVYSFAKRTHADPKNFTPAYAASLNSSTLRVVARYLKGTYFDANNYLHCSNKLVSLFVLKVHYAYVLLLFMIMSGWLYSLKTKCVVAEEKQKWLALLVTAWFSILAPLSWFVIFKAHSYIHVHMNYIVWQMPFILFGFAVCGAVAKILLTKPKPGSLN